MTRKEGYIDVEKMLQEIGVDTTSLETILESPLVTKISEDSVHTIFYFLYENETYFFKINGFDSYFLDYFNYKELVAEFLLEDFGLPTVDYDLAVIGRSKGTLSKNFKKENVNYIYGEELLIDFYKTISAYTEDYNNLEGIWEALEYRYRNLPNKREIVEKLMKRIVDIFLFDILCANDDRHSSNWCIVESKDGIDIGPVYDNENILSKRNFVSLDVSKNLNLGLFDDLKEFLSISIDEFKNIIYEKLWIISDENIKSVIKRIEDKTGYPMSEVTKEYYLSNFRRHKEKLENLLEEENNKEREEQYEGKNR